MFKGNKKGIKTITLIKKLCFFDEYSTKMFIVSDKITTFAVIL